MLPAATSPDEILADAMRYNAAPVILGANRDEIALLLSRSPSWTKTYRWISRRREDEPPTCGMSNVSRPAGRRVASTSSPSR